VRAFGRAQGLALGRGLRVLSEFSVHGDVFFLHALL